MKRIKTYLIILSLTFSSWAYALNEDFDLPKFVTTDLPFLTEKLMELTDHEKDMLLSLRFYGDVNNKCMDQQGKCTIYYVPPVTVANFTGPGGPVFNLDENARLVNINQRVDQVQNLVFDSKIRTLEKEIEYLKIKAEELEDAELEDELIETEEMIGDKTYVLSDLKHEVPEKILELYYDTVKFILATEGLSMPDVEDVESERIQIDALVNRLRKTTVAHAQFAVTTGFDNEIMSVLRKYKSNIKSFNKKFKFSKLQSTEFITVSPLRLTTPNVLTDQIIGELLENAELYKAIGTQKVAAGGGIVELYLPYSGYLALRKRALKKRSTFLPVRFEQKLEFQVPVKGSATCEFNRNFQYVAKISGKRENGAVVMPDLEFSSNFDGEDRPNLNDINCNIKTSSKIMSKVLLEKMRSMVDEFVKNHTTTLKSTFNYINAEKERLKEQAYKFAREKAPEKVEYVLTKLPEKKCEKLESSSSSNSGFLFFSSGGGRSNERIECFETYKTELTRKTTPMTVNITSKQKFQLLIKNKFKYSFDGVDFIKQEIAIPNQVCVRLQAHRVVEDEYVIDGNRCNFDERIESKGELYTLGSSIIETEI